MEKIVVIGSNSFSGSDFIDHALNDTNYRIHGVSRSPEKSSLFLPYKRNANLNRFSFHQMDLNQNMSELKKFLLDVKPEFIINFAAQSEVGPSWEHPEQWFRTNAVAIAELGNFLKSQDWLQRYVHISSPEVYGTCEGTVREDAPLNPSTPYAASKAAGDLMLFTLVKNFDFPLVMIRSTNVYGAHQQLFKIIPRAVIFLKKGKTIELHGGGHAVKSYIHIRDISRGELLAMLNGRNGQIYHLSPSDSGISIKNLVRMICDEMGKDFNSSTTAVAERIGQDKAYIIDSQKARQEMGWCPSIQLNEGLRDVICWVEANWDEISRQPLEYMHKP
ncbi:MAG: GDP-mannose 4,6-dehydratase [Methanoregula sp.]|uniref:GDP-mannose 4,6-dehydratase n=1 Tax=Methanoregula sp. TaxID=2052170 RepID=UPI003BAFF25F